MPDSNRKPTRRATLRFALLTLLGASALPLAARAASPGLERARLGRLVRALFRDLDAARAVGRRYLAEDPAARAETTALFERLLAARPADPDALRQCLARFTGEAAGPRAVVLVDGWVLPKGEAQACALTTLG